MTQHNLAEPDRPVARRRWRGPFIGAAAISLAAAATLTFIPNASAASFALEGWATQGGGTTGGGNASAVTVTNATALINEMKASGARVIRVSGTINISGMQKVAANKTVQGVGHIDCLPVHEDTRAECRRDCPNCD